MNLDYVQARYIQFNSLAPCSGTGEGLTELEVYGSSTLPIYKIKESFLKYTPRNARGNNGLQPMAILEKDKEAVNAANGNMTFTIPVLSRPGRNGLGLNLAVTYNSKIWELCRARHNFHNAEPRIMPSECGAVG
jgi:hypothetical protein